MAVCSCTCAYKCAAAVCLCAAAAGDTVWLVRVAACEPSAVLCAQRFMTYAVFVATGCRVWWPSGDARALFPKVRCQPWMSAQCVCPTCLLTASRVLLLIHRHSAHCMCFDMRPCAAATLRRTARPAPRRPVSRPGAEAAAGCGQVDGHGQPAVRERGVVAPGHPLLKPLTGGWTIGWVGGKGQVPVM